MPKAIHLLSQLLFLPIAINFATAQKLPNKQEVSLRAPVGIKIDGRSTDWNDRFQAYNNATDVFYSIANDDKNFYLLIRATETTSINKIIANGLVLSIQDPQKKIKGLSITYPLIERKDKFEPLFTYNKKNPLTGQKADSLMNSNNHVLAQRSKFIRVAGIEGVDTLISVYNQNDIMAAGLFDNKSNYTCELAISLKHLGILPDKSGKVAYHIQLYGLKGTPDLILTPPADDPQLAALINNVNSIAHRTTSSTDFWGEYTLAK